MSTNVFFIFIYELLSFLSIEKTLDSDQEKCEEDEEEEEESIDVGVMDNVKTAGGALLLLVLFLRIQSIIILLSPIPHCASVSLLFSIIGRTIIHIDM